MVREDLKRQQQQQAVDADYYQSNRQAHSELSAKQWTQIVGAICVFGVVGVLLKLAWPVLAWFGPIIGAALAISVSGTIIALPFIGYQQLKEANKRKNYLAHVFPVDENGNYSSYHNELQGRFEQPTPGNMPVQVPNSLTNHNDIGHLLKLLDRMQRQQQQLPGTNVQEVPQEQAMLPMPSSVRYEDVRTLVPRGHVLVGVGRDGIETKESAVGACVWIVGLSGTGKTSTAVLRVEERHAAGHKFLGIDPHWFKDDSLTNALAYYARDFVMPMARTPEDTKTVLRAFLAEYQGRKGGTIPKPWQPLTLVVDEVNALMDPTTPEEEENAKLLPTIARICGQEARNFLMGGIFISQQATGLSWLRKVSLMVLVHQLLMDSEKKVALNEDRAAMEDMRTWPVGRTYVYGVGFQEGPRTVQQPFYAAPVVDADSAWSYSAAGDDQDDDDDDVQDAIIQLQQRAQQPKPKVQQQQQDDMLEQALAAHAKGARTIDDYAAALNLTQHEARKVRSRVEWYLKDAQ